MNVIIIGGSGGIGKALIQSLISESVYVINIDKRKAGIRSFFYSEFIVELTKGNVEKVIQSVLNRFASIDGLVSTIGYYGVNNLFGFSYEEYKKTMTINLEIPTLCAINVINKMISQNRGKLIFVSSAAAYVGSRDIPYSVSKSGLIGLVKGLSKNLSEIDVYVYGIAPGIVETDMSHNMSNERKNDAIYKTLNKRMCNPIEVANLIRFLLLEDKGYMNGSVIHINDGLYMN